MNVKGMLKTLLPCVFWMALVALPAEERTGSQPSVLLLKVGSVTIRAGQQVVLEDRITSVFGEALYAADGELAVLVRPRQENLWLVVRIGRIEPGGVFRITGIEFPRIGDYELLVAAFRPGELAVGERLQQSRWERVAVAVSDRVPVFIRAVTTVAAPPQVAIVSLSGVAVRPREVNPVPHDVDLEISAPVPAWVYLVVRIPYTDRCHLLGPATRERSSGNYLLQGVPLQAPGDARQAHFELVTVAASRPLRTGPVSCESIRSWGVQVSLPFQVVTDMKQPPGESQRVAYISLARIGPRTFGPAQVAAVPTLSAEEPVQSGDRLEISAHERLPQGTLLYAATRYRGTGPWLIQGPAVSQGAPSPGLAELARPVTYVWLNLRFVKPPGQDNEDEASWYEVIAVASTDSLPNGWIDTAFLASRRLEGVSETVVVRALGEPAAPPAQPSISRIGSQDVDAEGEISVGASERVEVKLPRDAPKWAYVGVCPAGCTTWSFTETIPIGETRVAPEVSFSSPHAKEGSRYQLIAICTHGPLPGLELPYEAFLPHAAAASEIVKVRYSKGLLSGLKTWVSSLLTVPSVYAQSPSGTWLPGDGEHQPTAGSAGERGLPGWLLLLGLLLSAAAAVALEWRFRAFSEVSRRAANTLQHLRTAASERFVVPAGLNPSHFLLGLTMLILALFVITRHYIRLLAGVAHKVTGLEPKEAMGLALWLIIIVGMLGVIIDLAFKSSQPRAAEDRRTTSFFRGVFIVSVVAAFVLWVFEGGLYFSSFSTDAEGIVAPLAFLVFFLIALAETLIFFFITELTLPTLGWLVVLMILAPVYFAELGFRVAETLLRAISSPR